MLLEGKSEVRVGCGVENSQVSPVKVAFAGGGECASRPRPLLEIVGRPSHKHRVRLRHSRARPGPERRAQAVVCRAAASSRQQRVVSLDTVT